MSSYIQIKKTLIYLLISIIKSFILHFPVQLLNINE